MKIELSNVGILKSASVRLDGLTVITGLNDSGKSTVGKTLYGLFHGMNFYQDSIDRDRVGYLTAPFLRKIREENIDGSNLQGDYFIARYELRSVIKAYFEDDTDKASLDIQMKCAQLKSRVEVIVKKLGLGNSDYLSLNAEFEKRFQEVLQPSFLLKVKKNVVRETFLEEFAGHYINVFNKAMARISISDDENSYTVELSDNEIYGLENNIADSLNFQDVVLIDTPMILNGRLETNMPLGYTYQSGHRQELINKIMNISEKVKVDNIIENSVAKEQIENLNDLIDKIENILQGRLSVEDDNLYYEMGGEKLSVSSLASGMKTYVIIKRLIDNGYLNKKSLLIIDEPEVHLHPEWQMDFAELLVLLQKEIGIRVILTTHSPYFLEAIEVYSKKYGIADSAHFYIAERAESGAVLKPIDDNIEETYKMLARPFIKLRDMENEMLMKEKADIGE